MSANQFLSLGRATLAALLLAVCATAPDAAVAAASAAASVAQASNAATTTTATAVDASGPQQLIESAANAMLRELSAHRAEYRKDPDKVYALVDRILLPHFDVDYAARLVLAKNWRTATPEQRKRFSTAFYHSLLANYGDALIDFSGDRIKVLPSQVDGTAVAATVRSEVKRSNGSKVPVNYTLRKTEQGWKAWDVVIEGISYVKSFREDFGNEIETKGLDAVIQRLEAQAKAPKKT